MANYNYPNYYMGNPYMQNPMLSQQNRLQSMENQFFGNNQQPQQNNLVLKGRPVTSFDEAKASMIDLDGSVFIFPDYASGKIYTKHCDGFNFNQIENGIRGIQNGLCDGFYAQNTTMLQGFNGIQRDMCQGFSTLNSGITNLGYQMQNCCCDTNRNIDAVRYEAAKNTCDITTAIHAEGEATRALINANTMQDLRDRLEARDRELMTANFQLSQQAQTANLVDELRPCSRPAYITCSPYESANSRLFGYGRDCGCGCGC